LDGGKVHVFLKRLNNFRLDVEGVPAQVKRSLAVAIEPTLPGLPAEKLRLFWRFKGAQWCGGDPAKKLTVPFPETGRYEIEVVGMDAIGGISQTAALVVNAVVPLPETTLTEEGPYEANDVVWRLPAEAVASEPDAVPELAYRVDGGAWRLAGDSKSLPIGGFEPGVHVIEIATQEGDAWRDLTPLRLSVKYAPDYNFIVESRLDILASGDAKRAEAALAEIHMAGPEVIPILSEKLAEARKWSRAIERLTELLQALERERREPSRRPQ
jgi:hypothetical protein